MPVDKAITYEMYNDDTMKDIELHNDTLLILIDKNRRKSKEKETRICELERMSIVGTISIVNYVSQEELDYYHYYYSDVYKK